MEKKSFFGPFWCKLEMHNWYKSGATRTGNLIRECTCCGKRQQGFEDRNEHNNRIIVWYDLEKILINKQAWKFNSDHLHEMPTEVIPSELRALAAQGGHDGYDWDLVQEAGNRFETLLQQHAEMLNALHRLETAANDSLGMQYGTLSASFVKNIIADTLIGTAGNKI